MGKPGRPPKYKTAEELEKKINEYFEVECKDEVIETNGKIAIKHNPPTISGLALYLGFLNRRSIYDYIARDESFSHTIKKAVAKIEDYAEKQLFVGNSTGAIFWLKNKGWSDKKELQHSGNVDTTINITIDDEDVW